jgi:hypothetical protein
MCVDTSRSSTGLCGEDTFRNSKGSYGNTQMWDSNGNGIEAKLSESFDNDFFFDIEAKRRRSIV